MLYCDYDTYSAMGGTMSAEPVSYTHLSSVTDKSRLPAQTSL